VGFSQRVPEGCFQLVKLGVQRGIGARLGVAGLVLVSQAAQDSARDWSLAGVGFRVGGADVLFRLRAARLRDCPDLGFQREFCAGLVLDSQAN